MVRFLLIVLIPMVLFAETIDEVAQNLGRGVNLGNVFEPPKEGDWGVTMEWAYLDTIAAKGFSHIRVPVRWQTHFDSESPLTINPAFLRRIDTTVDRALALGMYVLLDAHHYETLYEDPDGKREEFLKLWSLLANHYKDRNDSLLFEPLNEPHGNLSAEKWNSMLSAVLDTIRLTNPTRPVVIGLAEYGGMDGLAKLVIPEKEKNAIVSVHYYLPFQFTHQGASWVGEQAQDWLGTTWDGTYQEKMDIFSHLEKLQHYVDTSGYPIHIGEFGAYEKAPMESRARWTEFCGRAFEKFGFPWTYWEFCSGFGLYDAEWNQWKGDLVDPLLSDDTTILELIEDEYDPSTLVNGDFSDGMNKWVFGVWNKDKGAATQKIVNGVSEIQVTETATNFWEIQLIYKYLTMKKGEKYRISVTSSSPDGGSYSVGVTSDGDYKNYYSSAVISPTSESKTERMLFTAPADHDTLMLAFNLSHSTGIVQIDEVLFQKMQSSEAVVTPDKNGKVSSVWSGLNLKNRTLSFTNSTKSRELKILKANGSLISQYTIGNGIQQVRLPDSLSTGIVILKMGPYARPLFLE